MNRNSDDQNFIIGVWNHVDRLEKQAILAQQNRLRKRQRRFELYRLLFMILFTIGAGYMILLDVELGVVLVVSAIFMVACYVFDAKAFSRG